MRIKEVLKEKSCTQQMLADRINVSLSAVKQMVSAESLTTSTLLLRSTAHIAERVSISRLNNSIKKDILNTQNSTYLKVYQN